MAEKRGPKSNSDKKQLDIGDFARGAQSTKAFFGCIAVVLFLAALIFAARTFLFR